MIWATVLALALVVAPDPTRLAIVALLISRPRPLVNLLVFWLGGMASGTAIALGSVLLLHDFALMVTQHVASAFAALKSGYVGIVIGALRAADRRATVRAIASPSDGGDTQR